jgi:hypothetical protein
MTWKDQDTSEVGGPDPDKEPPLVRSEIMQDSRVPQALRDLIRTGERLLGLLVVGGSRRGRGGHPRH